MAEHKEIVEATANQLREARRQVKVRRDKFIKAKLISDSAKVRLDNAKDLVLRLDTWMQANGTA